MNYFCPCRITGVCFTTLPWRSGPYQPPHTELFTAYIPRMCLGRGKRQPYSRHTLTRQKKTMMQPQQNIGGYRIWSEGFCTSNYYLEWKVIGRFKALQVSNSECRKKRRECLFRVKGMRLFSNFVKQRAFMDFSLVNVTLLSNLSPGCFAAVKNGLFFSLVARECRSNAKDVCLFWCILFPSLRTYYY